MGKIGYSTWIGEFGWEIQWQAYLRKLSYDYDSMIISTFQGMEPLYKDFHCPVEFHPHTETGRALDWRDISHVQNDVDISSYTKQVETIQPLKQYRLDGEYVRYGTPRDTGIEVLFHARGVDRSTFKNYPPQDWIDVAAAFPKAACVGTMDDQLIPGVIDKRGIPLDELMDLIASAHVIVGGSSGVMHLASLCGTRQVVWADNKTYFGESLEKRYKETWNPFGTPVSWIESKNWHPASDDVIVAVLSGAAEKRPTATILDKLKTAVDTGEYMIALSWIGEQDKKRSIISYCETVNFPPVDLAKAIEQMKGNMDEIASKDSKPDKEVASVWR